MSNASFKTQWQKAIVNAEDAKPLTRLILWTLSSFMDADGSNCFPSIAAMMKASGLSNRTVIDHLNYAENAGWFSRTQARTSKGWKHYTYNPLFPSGQDASEGASLATKSSEVKAERLASEGASLATDGLQVNMPQHASEADDNMVVKELHTTIPSTIPKTIIGEFKRLVNGISDIIAPSRINPSESLRAFKRAVGDGDPEKIADAVMAFYADQKGISPKFITGLAKVIREESYQPFLNAKRDVPKPLASNAWDLVHKGTISEEQLYEWVERYERNEISNLSEFMPLPENVTRFEKHRSGAAP